MKTERRYKKVNVIYNQLFEPAVRIGENYAVFTAQGAEKWYQCVYVEPLPASIDLVQDFGAISTGLVSRSNQVTALEMEGSAKTENDLSELFQVRIRVIDDITIAIKEPSALSRFKTKNDEIRIDYNTEILDPSLKTTELFVHEDDTLYVDAYNTTQYDITRSRVQFFGWRIVGAQLYKKPDKLTYIVASGFSK